MRIWLSKNQAVSVREQLATQLMLGIMSQDLKPGERLPSTRDLARRYNIHANTVSAAYRDLANRGWLEHKAGSGVFVLDPRTQSAPAPQPSLDHLIETFFAATRSSGFPMSDVQRRLSQWLCLSPVRRIVVIEPEPELRDVLITELRDRLSLPVLPLGPQREALF